MLVPNRHGSSNSYRYGFQGQEKDDEIKGEGNSYDFGERLLDTRIGRWWSTDNVEKPWLSPYQFAGNDPANHIDPDGNDEIHFYYRTQNVFGSDGKIYIEVTLSSEIIKNNLDHTFYMHSPTGSVVQFHPFKSDLTQSKTTEAYDNNLVFAKGIKWFFGFFEKKVDDPTYLGILLKASPEIMEYYKNANDGTGLRLQGTINKANSLDLTETLITAQETIIAVIEGYGLVKGLSKFVVKEIAKNTIKVVPKLGELPIAIQGKTTTVLGRLKDTRPLADKLKNVKSGANKGGFNILNQPDNYWSLKSNMQWLQRAIDRGDIIRAASDPTDLKNIFKNGKDGARTVYGEEVKYLTSKGYSYDKTTSSFVK